MTLPTGPGIGTPGPATPDLVDQPGPNGTWRARRTGRTDGSMEWEGGPDGPFDRLEDQPHDEGTWVAGPHASMTWTPTTSEDTP